MKVSELIEKLKEFDGEMEVHSVEYASESGYGCCGGTEYEYGPISPPRVEKQTVWRSVQVKDGRTTTGFRYRKWVEETDVVVIDAR